MAAAAAQAPSVAGLAKAKGAKSIHPHAGQILANYPAPEPSTATERTVNHPCWHLTL
jgi:hypothetical protein